MDCSKKSKKHNDSFSSNILKEDVIKNTFWDFREKINIVTDNQYFDLSKHKTNDKSEMSMLQWFESKYCPLHHLPYKNMKYLCDQ